MLRIHLAIADIDEHIENRAGWEAFLHAYRPNIFKGSALPEPHRCRAALVDRLDEAITTEDGAWGSIRTTSCRAQA